VIPSSVVLAFVVFWARSVCAQVTPAQGEIVLWYPTGQPTLSRAAIVTHVVDPVEGLLQLSCQSLPGDHAFYLFGGRTLSVPYAGGPVPAMIRHLSPLPDDWWVAWGMAPTYPQYIQPTSPLLTLLPNSPGFVPPACPSGSGCGWATVKIPRWTTVGQPGWVERP
jgi:hypothetical protein